MKDHALETSLVEWKQNFAIWENKAGQSLGNFLSGMETENAKVKYTFSIDLGNFLSGMETQRLVFRHISLSTLETSLVEWKLTR